MSDERSTVNLSAPTTTTASSSRSSTTRPTLPPSVATATGQPAAIAPTFRLGAARCVAALDVRVFALEAFELDVLFGRELLRSLACLAPGFVQFTGGARLEIADRPLDLGACIQQISSRVLARVALGDSLSLAHVVLALCQRRHSLPCVVEDRRGLPLARRELLVALLELLDQRGQLALVLRHALFRARHDLIGSRSRRAIEMPYDRPGMPLINR